MQSWDIVISSPLGETRARLDFEDAGGRLVGRMTGKGGDGPMEDTKIDGDRLAWSCRIQKPAPMTLKFKGERQGGTMAGKVKFGLLASGSFTAQRRDEAVSGS